MMEVPQAAIDHAEKIWSEGTPEEKLAFFAFEESEPPKMIAFKFTYWIYRLYPRYLQSAPAPFHEQMALNMINAYYGNGNYTNLGFRGCAKTTYAKLFIAFALLNDMEHRRKYIKVLARNLNNSKGMVTDIFNLIVEVKPLYGNLFPKKKEQKGEETMLVFTTVDGVKLMAGTVGMTQRGHVQDAYRPDLLIFDDVEDRESISSLSQTESTIWRIDEAIQGLAADGAYMVLGNYISEEGVIQWFINKPNMVVDKITIQDEDGNPTWPERYPAEKIELIKGDADDFYGEYMCDPSRTDAAFFDRQRIDNDIAACKQPHRESAGVKYWGDFQPHHRYGIGADTSEGIGKDANTMALFDFGVAPNDIGILMATYFNNRIPPDLFGYELKRVGGEFGNCLVAPEANNCFSKDTEVLTDSGWKLFQQLTDEDNVATFNMESEKIEFQIPEGKHEVYQEKMYKIKQGRTDLLVSPDHRLLYKKRNGTYDFTTAALIKRDSQHPKFIHAAPFDGVEQDTFTTGDFSCQMNDFLNFLGVFIADGNCTPKKYNGRLYYEFTLAQSDSYPDKQQFIDNAIKSIGLHASTRKQKTMDGYNDLEVWKVCSKPLCTWLWNNVGVGSEKKIPDMVMRLSRQQRRVFLESFFVGDGYERHRPGKNFVERTYYPGTAKTMADQLQALLVLDGNASKIKPRFFKHVNYEVNEQATKYTHLKDSDLEIVDYNDYAYCVSVPNQTLVVRRNHNIIITGNTGHATIAAMRGYPNIFAQRTEGNRQQKVTEKLGWRTTKKSKPQMLFDFRKDYNDGLIKIYDVNVLKEMRSYTTADLNDVQLGMVTRHFDLFMACCIAWQMRKYAVYGYHSQEIPEEEEPLFSEIGI